MGTEQSAQAVPGRIRPVDQLRRGRSVTEQDASNDHSNRSGNISPGPSICSDSDLPYISYTVNRPIGDSPKLSHKHPSHLKRGKSLGNSPSYKNSGIFPKKPQYTPTKSTHNIVVVKTATSIENAERDPDLQRLESIPMFLPIMRGTLNLPAVRDPEVLERLDPASLYNLCLRYQQHLAISSEIVASEQNQLGCKVREVDTEIIRQMALITERRKKCAEYAEKLRKVHELSHHLNRCHMLLNETLESMETLNNLLPLEERLEPFVWTTG